jgi:nucleoside 2-deoxyribosyltransferase
VTRARVPSVYLAGPEVFLANAAQLGQEKKARCERRGFSGRFPLEPDLAFEADEALSGRIFEANVALLRACDAVVANLTPFRGASADVGTVFEIGFARALGKPIFAYANVVLPY